MPKVTVPLTKEQVQDAFRRAGMTYVAWARANGFNPQTVTEVLNGFRKGHSGEAHRVAVALGMKVGQVVDAANFNPATNARSPGAAAGNGRPPAKPGRARARK